MDGLVKRIMESTNLDEAKANEIATIAQNYLAEKLSPRILKKVNKALQSDVSEKTEGKFGSTKDVLGN